MDISKQYTDLAILSEIGERVGRCRLDRNLTQAKLAAVAGGVLWKFAVITRACHQQGFAVPMMPQRGSGTRAAPPRYEAA